MDTRLLARWLIGAVFLTTLAKGGELGSTWVLRRWQNGETGPLDLGAVDLLDSVSNVSLVVTVLAGFASAVLWMVWLSYAYSNLPALGSTPNHKRFWAWLGWFVPIWGLFRPKQLHDEVWMSGERESVPYWMHVWWLLFLTSWVLTNAESPIEYTWVGVFASVSWILASVPAIAVIWLSAVQQWKAHHFDGQEASVALGLGSKIAPFGAAIASFGVAVLIIVLPHSGDLPEAVRVFTAL